jgi:hypothetical protein
VGAAGGALAASAAVVVGCDDEEQAPPADWNGQVISRFVNADLPDDPGAALWDRGRQVVVPLTPQTSAIPFKPQPSVPSILVRSIYNQTKVGFLLEWADARLDDRVVKTNEFRDGCGVSIGPVKAPATFLTMGTADVPASILYWRADWQKDIDEGFQDLEAAFPNAAFDFYPPLVDAPHPLPINDSYAQEGRQWLVGWSAGNPLSQPTKTSAVEKLLGRGPGTLAHLPTQDATGAGVWKDGRWKVMLIRNLAAADDGETALGAGGEYALLFTVWSGSDHDRGSRKSPSGMGKLLLEQV